MNLKKTLAKSLVAFLFATFLSFAVLSFSLVQITDKEVMKPIALEIASQQISSDQLEQIHEGVIQLCGDQESVDIVFQNITINCEEIRSSEPNKLIEIIYSENIEKIYNAPYDCEFLDCIQKQPAVIFSSVGNQFFLSITYLSVILTIIFGILLAVLSKDAGIFSIVRAFGWSFFFVGITYFIVLAAKEIVIPVDIKAVVGSAIDMIFGIILFNLLIALVAGIALLAIGYAEKFTTKKKRR